MQSKPSKYKIFEILLTKQPLYERKQVKAGTSHIMQTFLENLQTLRKRKGALCICHAQVKRSESGPQAFTSQRVGGWHTEWR